MADPEHEPQYSTGQSHPAYPQEPTSSWIEQHGSDRGAALSLTAIFLGSCLLLINSLTVYQGDERYYTDAAIRMMQSGDYLTPHFDDGEPRFLKPILSYWPLVASFRLFGINLPASRIPPIIAGCFVVWLTYQLAQVLFRHNGIAALAAAVLASNANFLHASLRARPDIYLCLFVTVSLYGFARLLFRDTSAYSYACAYLGSGLAVATKGFPGLLPVAFASLFCLLRRANDCKSPRLVHLPSIVAGLAIGLCWFILMYILHGTTAIESFYSDQIEDRLAGSAIHIFHNGFKYLTSMAGIFSPWFVIVVLLLMRFDNAATYTLKKFRNECLFSLGWFMTVMVVYLGGMTNRNRYMLPAFPLLACFIAVMLEPCLRGGMPGRLLYKILPTCLSALGLIWGTLLVAMGLRLHFDLVVGGVICLLAASGLFVLTRRSRPLTRVVAIAGFLLVFFTGHELFTHSVFQVSPVSAWLETIQREHIDLQHAAIGTVGIRPTFIGQARLLSNGRLHFRQLPDDGMSMQTTDYRVLIASEQFSRQLSGAGFALTRSGFVYRNLTWEDLWHLLRSENRQGYLSSLRIPSYVAVRKTP
jgi:4-amino-4-deoxy-L-arabinose transferase-like glycosyltransferase